MDLFVIGNGFDIAHGLETSYSHFRDYLKDENPNYLNSLEQMYGFSFYSDEDYVKEYLWRDFETNLSNIDEIEIIEEGECIDLGLEGGDIGIEDTLNEHWENRYGFIKRLNDFVTSWIEQVDIDIPRRTDKISEYKNDLFITFNYTLLLEEIYNIDKFNILHIHGSIDEDNDSDPIIGHGDKSKIIETEVIAKEAGENLDEKKCSIYEAVSNYYKRTLKNVDAFIIQNNRFFCKLRNVKSIHIVGHSLGDVDIPYFEEIRKHVNPNTIWNIYYYCENDEQYFRNKILSIGVDACHIRMLRSQEFFIR